jgi:tripartite-type tricarboxylate transporter receptor subunit TctC
MIRIALCVVACLAVASTAQAQPYPNKPVRIVSGYAPGGSSDIGIRFVTQKLSESAGWPAPIIENRPGGGGVVAAEVVKQAQPDGYTLFLSDISALAINVSLAQNLPYDAVKDFTPIMMMWSFPSVLVVPKDSPARTGAELIALAKTKAGGLTYASQGMGSGGHLLGTMLQNSVGTNMIHVPYRGAGAAMPDVAAGRVDFIFASYGSVKQYIEAGTVRLLAVTAKQRLPDFPNAPTMTELGHGSVFLDVWFGLSGPANMPAPIVNSINDAVGKVLKSPDMLKRLADVGLYADPTTPDQYRDLIRSDIARLGKVVKDANIKQE